MLTGHFHSDHHSSLFAVRTGDAVGSELASKQVVPGVSNPVRGVRRVVETSERVLNKDELDISHFLRDSEIRQGLRLSCTDPTQSRSWEVRARELGTTGFFHGTPWAAVLKQAFGFTPYYLVLHDRERTLGLLAIMEVRTSLTPVRGVSLPFTDFCPAIASEDSLVEPLFRAAHAIGVSRSWRYLEIRGGQRVGGGDSSSSTKFLSHSVDLPLNPDLVYARFKPEVRTAIRKAVNNGVSVSIDRSMEAIREFYRLYLLTRKKHGLPPQPFSFFKAIHRHVMEEGLGIVALARWRGEAIAAGVVLHCGGNAVFKYGASHPKHLSLRANDLVMWRAIQWCVEAGITSLHLGRTSSANSGLRRFKRGWGSHEQRLDYFRHVCQTGEILRVTDRAAGWYNQVLRKLPISVLRCLGASLYKHTA